MRNRPLCSICLLIALVIMSGTVCGREKFIRELFPSAAERYLEEGDKILLKGKVYQKADKEKYQVLYLKDNFIEYHQRSLKESRIIIYDEKIKETEIGDTVLVRGEISFFENARNPGNFDMKLYYQRQDIHASVWASSVECLAEDKRTPYEEMKNRLYEFRQEWKEKICNALGEEEGNTLSAMLLGEKSQMDGELRELYQVNGIGHILAISGVHTSILGINVSSRNLGNKAFVGSFVL